MVCAVVLSALGSLAACGSAGRGGTTPSPRPASSAAATSSTAEAGTGGVTAAANAARLAGLDGNQNPPSVYESAIATLETTCKLNATDVASLADAGYHQLLSAGITTETRLGLLQELRTATTASVGLTDCAQILTAYLVERETPASASTSASAQP